MGVAYSGDLLSKKHVHVEMVQGLAVRPVLVRTSQVQETACHQVRLRFEAVKRQEGRGFYDHR